jgi:hypothetical protein
MNKNPEGDTIRQKPRNKHEQTAKELPPEITTEPVGDGNE